jgi:PilZ domain-containing protein
MKRLFDLTVEDLSATPVWRYEGGNGVEAIVVPESRDSLTQADDEVFLAATEFHLPDSSPWIGFCFPVDDAGMDYLQPVIVTPAGHVRFWFEGTVAPEVLASQWTALGKREDEVFPLNFRCRVPVDGRMIEGIIPRVEISAPIAPVGPVAPPEEEQPAAEDFSLPSRPARVRRLFEASAGVQEKRSAARRRAEMLVEFREGNSPGAGVTSDFSRGGIFIRSAEAPQLGPSLALTMHLPGGRTVLLKGRVVRKAPGGIARPAGFALEVTEKTEDYEAFLARLLDPTK